MTGGDRDLAELWLRTLHALDVRGISPSERAFVGFARVLAVVEHTVLVAVPDDYTKKSDGTTASDVSNTSYDGNALARIPPVWMKQWDDGANI